MNEETLPVRARKRPFARNRLFRIKIITKYHSYYVGIIYYFTDSENRWDAGMSLCAIFSQVEVRSAWKSKGYFFQKKCATYVGINTSFCGSQLHKLLITEPVLILTDPRPKNIPKYFLRFINTYLRRAQISQYLVPDCTVVSAMLQRHAIYLGHVFAPLMHSARDIHGSGCMPMQPSIWNFINVPWKSFVTRSCITTPM